ncbi:hypothetical protein Leryth_019677 [Lithospermum erythrorhizon]|nr:hypothetical protein Leryth_019677 [Lithospermum erythrorhizon]
MTSKPLSPQEWDHLIDDYNHGDPHRLRRWTTTHHTFPHLFQLSLSTLLRKDITLNLKLNILIFLEQHHLNQNPFDTRPEKPASIITSTRPEKPDSDSSTSSSVRDSLDTRPEKSDSSTSSDPLDKKSDSITSSTVMVPFTLLLNTLRTVIQTPNDAVSITFSLKEQFLISTTSIFISSINNIDNINIIKGELEGLIELLLTIVNRPNHGVDRVTRGVACECLRELEVAFPCLLSGICSNLWGLCQIERTHVGQCYVLLLATVVRNIVMSSKKNVGFVSNSSLPLIPFSVSRFLSIVEGDDGENEGLGEERDASSYRELKRVISFLLEWPGNLTPCGVVEFINLTMPVAKALDLQASLLKVQFSGLIYTFDPLLWHAFLGLYMRFCDSFEGQELDIARRLLLVSREGQQNVVVRMLVIHWLLALVQLVLSRDVGKREGIVHLSLKFYPRVFDSLAIKSLRLDLLAYCSVLLDGLGSNGENMSTEIGSEISVAKLLEDALICVSDFKWLPPWSTETVVVFRTLHKFMICASSHSGPDTSPDKTLTESTRFRTIQNMLVESALEFQGLVPVIVTLVDRFLWCQKHRWLGECLLKTFDEQLLKKLKIDYKLGSYFPIFERIAENNNVSPDGLIDLLVKFMIFLVEKHGPDAGLRSWCLGSEVIRICRTLLIHHYRSRIFSGLSELLGLMCLYFPDVEVRDSARIYLRMLISIPGKKLKELLNVGDKLLGISPATQSTSFFNLQSPKFSYDPKKSKHISNYIHLERKVPLLVKQSWSLQLSTLIMNGSKPAYLEGILDSEHTSEQNDLDRSNGISVVSDISETNRIDYPQEPLRVMDSKISEIVGMLRTHFSSIPDFRHMPGLRIKIPCYLSFESDPFTKTWEIKSTSNGIDVVDSVPAMYAVVLKFSASPSYGSIPSSHIPFLIGEAPKNEVPNGQTISMDIVPVGKYSSEDKSFGAPVIVDLEPREPIPGLVDVFIEANTDNGQIIQGQLHSISVGIEDMFLKAIIPENIPTESVPTYYEDLFYALWEACGASSSTGREGFILKGGRGLAAISGTHSVKLLEVPVTAMVQAVERCLASFVVSIVGEHLIDIVKDREIFSDTIWKYSDPDLTGDVMASEAGYGSGPLYLKDKEEEDDRGGATQTRKKNFGYFLVLIFLPPRFHILLQMEVSAVSTLVRIRTDHWPCLAYIDEYLEALFFE